MNLLWWPYCEVVNGIVWRCTLLAESPCNPLETCNPKETLPKSCIFSEVAAVQEFGRDKPVWQVLLRTALLKRKSGDQIWAHGGKMALDVVKKSN